MSAAHFKVLVNAPLPKLWDILLDEMENPEAYSNTILGSEVLERFSNGLLRQISVPDAKVRERIVYDYNTQSIVSTLVGHPELIGVITKSISKGSSGLELESSLEWKTIETRVEEMLTRNVHDFMMEQLNRIKAKAES